MSVEIIVSCMHQTDASLLETMNIKGNVLLVNQCDHNQRIQFTNGFGIHQRMIATTERGLSNSRNMGILRAEEEILMICDDDEVVLDDCEQTILDAYQKYPDADIILFDIYNFKKVSRKGPRKLTVPYTFKVGSVHMTLRRSSVLKHHIQFDPKLGAGTVNGAGEETKFILDCFKQGLNIYYYPAYIASLEQTESTWFEGFTEPYFELKGRYIRYIFGLPIAACYGVYFLVRKRKKYGKDIGTIKAARGYYKGIFERI